MIASAPPPPRRAPAPGLRPPPALLVLVPERLARSRQSPDPGWGAMRILTLVFSSVTWAVSSTFKVNVFPPIKRNRRHCFRASAGWNERMDGAPSALPRLLLFRFFSAFFFFAFCYHFWLVCLPWFCLLTSRRIRFLLLWFLPFLLSSHCNQQIH